jgi:kinetochore protein Nuf2
MSEELTFPILDYKEITACLNELDIKIKIEDLKQPTVANTILIYKQLLNLITPQSVLQTDDDLMKESVQLFGFFKQLYFSIDISAKISSDCGCFISTRDVFNPTPKRTKYILSALINFCKFREDKIILFEQYSEQTETLLQEKLGLESKLSEKQEVSLSHQNFL